MFLLTDDMKSFKSFKSLKWYELFFLFFTFCQVFSSVYTYIFATEFNLSADLKEFRGFDLAIWPTIFAVISQKYSRSCLVMACVTFSFICVTNLIWALIISFGNLTDLETGGLLYYQGSVTLTGWLLQIIHPYPAIAALSFCVFFKQCLASRRNSQTT